METYLTDTTTDVIPSYIYRELADQGVMFDWLLPELCTEFYGVLATGIYRSEIAGWIG